MASASSITADDIFGAPAAPGNPAASATITSEDIFGDFKQSKTAGLEHTVQSPYKPQPGEFNFPASYAQSVLRDEGTTLKAVAKAIYPNDPDAVKKYNFRMVDGRVAYTPSDKAPERFATSTASNIIGGIAGNAPEIAGGIAGAVIGTAGGHPVLGGMLGATGARALQDVAVGQAYGEPQTSLGNAADLAKTAALEGAAGGAAKVGLGIAGRGRTLDISPANIAAAQAQRAGIKQSTGVDVDLALASGDPALLQVRNWLSQQPNQTARAIQAADADMAGQFEKATSAVLDRIATGAHSDVLGQKGINAAQEAIEAAKEARSTAVAPLYKAAGDVSLSADTLKLLLKDPVLRDAAKRVTNRPVFQKDLGVNPGDVAANTPRPKSKTELTWVEGVGFKPATPKARRASPNMKTVQFWHVVKKTLDDQISAAKAKGANNEARILAQARSSLAGKMEAASPEYAAANAEFARQSRLIVEPLENSIVGVLAKVNDQKAGEVAAKIFKGDFNVSPAEIFRARQVISKQDPEAWDGLVRQYIQNAYTKAGTATQGGGEVNAAGKMYQALYGNENRRQMLYAALGKDKADALEALMGAAKAAARAPVKGSNTQPNMAIARVFEGWAANLSSNLRGTLTQQWKEAATNKNAQKVWEALNDPAKVAKLRTAMRIPDETRRNAYVATTFLGTGSDVATDEVTR
ncbi:hypothetical protein [Caudoviricetes sp.]|nr:hypothetical protein [Caudoviricetes sp.]